MSFAEKLTAIAENQQAVYDAGKQKERDAFWDVFQINGERTMYRHGFSDGSFSFENFYPKYDIVPVGDGSNMFYGFARDVAVKQSLADRLTACGVDFDTSGLTSCGNLFAWTTGLDDIPTIDLTGIKSGSTMQNTFNASGATTIRKIIVKEDVNYENFFNSCTQLVNVTFEGVIGGTGFSVQKSPNLSHDSLMSILNCLATKTSGTWTVTLGTTNLAKLTDAEKAIATEKGWTIG